MQSAGFIRISFEKDMGVKYARPTEGVTPRPPTEVGALSAGSGYGQRGCAGQR